MTDSSLQRQRVAVSVLFILAGTVMGGWQGRIPSVRAQLGVGDGAWGLIVLGMPVGTLLALLVILPMLQGRAVFASMRHGGRALWISGVCWSVMFTAFMVALVLMP